MMRALRLSLRLPRASSRALVWLAVIAGCGSPSVPNVRFANAPAASAVNDRRDVPRRPAVRQVPADVYRLDGHLDIVLRPLSLARARRALGVNALDEVPDSTWFTNRIGARALSPDEIRVGPARIGSPEPHKPWTIHSTKIGGVAMGFIVSDARGKRWLLKFEEPGFPEVETGADAVTNRLLWAAGYNVPEDHVVYLRPGDLVLAKDAKIKGPFGYEKPLDRTELERRLARIDRTPDGRLRALASRMLDGKAIGGHPGRGVRTDDPNDRIPHELRRDLRGAYAFFAWLDQTDAKEDNTLDMWVADPADPKRHYVKHYLVDFGKSLGTTATTDRNPRSGHAYMLDFAEMFSSLATLGLAPRAWERRPEQEPPGVGLFETETFDPGAWKPNSPAYLPLRTADDHDKLWATRILIRFTREQIRAAVDTARLSDPRAAEYLVDTIVARQRATARYWFWRVSPLDGFALEGGARALCFDDLLLAYGLAPVATTTRYAVAAFDRSGRPLGAPSELRADPRGRTCAPVTLAPDRDGYSILRIETRRLHFAGTTYVHLARDPSSGAPRVIGLWRP